MDNLLKPDIWVALAIGAILLIVAWLLLQAIVRFRATGTPGVQAVLDALVPYIYQAIFAGERAVVWGFDVLEERIAATDKKAVADSIYNLLPPVIAVGSITVPTTLVKRLVPREEFERLVKDAYDSADAFLQRNEQFLKDQVAVLKETFPKEVG